MCWCQQQRAEAEQKDELFDWLIIRSLGLEHLQPRFVDEYQQLNVVLDGLGGWRVGPSGDNQPKRASLILLQEEIAGEGGEQKRRERPRREQGSGNQLRAFLRLGDKGAKQN